MSCDPHEKLAQNQNNPLLHILWAVVIRDANPRRSLNTYTRHPLLIVNLNFGSQGDEKVRSFIPNIPSFLPFPRNFIRYVTPHRSDLSGFTAFNCVESPRLLKRILI